jgi:hypothetical protein
METNLEPEKVYNMEATVRMKKNKFTLDGTIIKSNNYGIWFSTDQCTSFLNYDVIEYIKLKETR